eukprot:3729685-Heterocapsa_arctica.AAC.1
MLQTRLFVWGLEAPVAMKKAIVEALLFANKIVKIVQEDPEAGLTYRPGLMCPSKPNEKPQIIVMAVSDASHGNEEEYLDDWDEREAFRSQGAKIAFIADASAVHNDEAQVHMISFSSTVIKRFVNSTIKAETYQLTDVVEAADLIRAALADARGAVEERQWETTAAAWT